MPEDEVEVLFADFVTKFEKIYKNADERAMRMEIFRRNLKRIDEVRERRGIRVHTAVMS